MAQLIVFFFIQSGKKLKKVKKIRYGIFFEGGFVLGFPGGGLVTLGGFDNGTVGTGFKAKP